MQTKGNRISSSLKYPRLGLLFLILVSAESLCQEDRAEKLVNAALELTKTEVHYDPAYFRIDYPGGDIPEGKGVCTDVVIRAYRKLGIDLQREVHEDMRSNFEVYPKTWNLKSPDTNIDHRRVPNLMVFFERKGESLPLGAAESEYLPGDIVCWNLGGGIKHIGILSDQKSRDKKRVLVVHNIGEGQVLEDILFKYEIIGHYRY